HSFEISGKHPSTNGTAWRMVRLQENEVNIVNRSNLATNATFCPAGIRYFLDLLEGTKSLSRSHPPRQQGGTRL
ncbi:MAG TPA: hypothetical protein PKD54_03760, partial [Pirellulaceae bacterium]|nr:hypothetical protein [Pirellulaceae bacterium]